MILHSINLKNELVKISQNQPNNLLGDVNALLTEAANADDNILKHFQNAAGIEPSTAGKQVLSVDAVYTQGQVKALCIKFRLRFLPAAYYKGTLPYEAVQAIKAFEAEFNYTKAEYKIVAPAGFFKLKDRYADPLLFADLGDGKYYLLHQWGADFKPLSNALYFPMRDGRSAGISAIIGGLLITLLLFLSGGIHFPAENIFKGIVLCAAATVVCSMFVMVTGMIYALVTYSDLSEDTWNSPYFN